MEIDIDIINQSSHNNANQSSQLFTLTNQCIHSTLLPGLYHHIWYLNGRWDTAKYMNKMTINMVRTGKLSLDFQQVRLTFGMPTIMMMMMMRRMMMMMMMMMMISIMAILTIIIIAMVVMIMMMKSMMIVVLAYIKIHIHWFRMSNMKITIRFRRKSKVIIVFSLLCDDWLIDTSISMSQIIYHHRH